MTPNGPPTEPMLQPPTPDRYRQKPGEKVPVVVVQVHDARPLRGGRRAYKLDVQGEETRERIYPGDVFSVEVPAGKLAVVRLYRLDAADQYDSGLSIDIDAKPGKNASGKVAGGTEGGWSYYVHGSPSAVPLTPLERKQFIDSVVDRAKLVLPGNEESDRKALEGMDDAELRVLIDMDKSGALERGMQEQAAEKLRRQEPPTPAATPTTTLANAPAPPGSQPPPTTPATFPPPTGDQQPPTPPSPPPAPIVPPTPPPAS